jgi:hypothetical protein
VLGSNLGRKNNIQIYFRGFPQPFQTNSVSGPTLAFNQPTIQWVWGALSPRVNRPRREADQSPPSSAEVKKGGAMLSLPPYVFMACDNFSFTTSLHTLIHYPLSFDDTQSE